MSHSVRRHLRVEVDAYDAMIRRFIPGYETMLATAAEQALAVGPARVVDLGAGTGALSEAVLERDGDVVVELVDIDAEMLAQARGRLARFGDRARFNERSFDGPLPSCQAFVASLSLHHIPELESKRALFARAFEALDAGGVLVNADANMPEEEEERSALFRYWADHLVSCGISEADAWRHFEEWAEEDTYMPLDRELAALAEVGFTAERVWSRGPIGVMVARKAAP